MMGFPRIRALGHTLVELLLVLSLLAIVTLGTTRFLTDGTDGYATTVSRSNLTESANQIALAVARELRGALPGSVRVSGGRCLEFVPGVAVSAYTSAPIGYPSAQLDVLRRSTGVSWTGVRTVIAPVDVYTVSSQGTLSGEVVGEVVNGNVLELTLAQPHNFPRGSPAQRIYAVDGPISYCGDAGAIYRYEGYGFRATQPLPNDLPGTLPNRQWLADGITSAGDLFVLADPSLQRASLVAINLTLAEGDDTVTIVRHAQVRHAI